MPPFDPSSRGINKQMMLDWMRINHPMTPINSGALKQEIACIVRGQQPAYFPNPQSDAPAVDVPAGTPRISGDPPAINSNPANPAQDPSPIEATVGTLDAPGALVTDSSIGLRLVRFNQPTMLLIGCVAYVPLQLEEKPKQLSCSQMKSGAVNVPQAKRAPSAQINIRSLKRSSMVPPITSPSEHTKAPKKLKTRSKSEGKPRQYLDVSLLEPISSPSGPSVTANIVSKAKVKIEHQSYPLIDLGDVNLMDEPNPVVGEDIPTIVSKDAPGTLPTITYMKSGADIFQEERKHDKRQNLTSRMEMNEKSDMSALAEEMRREEETRVLQERLAGLEKTIETYRFLHDRIQTLEAEVSDLSNQLNDAVDNIQAQEEVITGLMKLDEEENGDSTDESEGTC
ncbi:uncharacterized protein MELLADRAFT_96290 [Melampsora larici-populina 98AG31]|uniref:Uncharacterized protein n=1 Tax=Melampsora larici-populina (strain 98AG31 / pathotype 3-4-7) TaxID=747676 RepID=F4RE87_MELLP|nr:uncharacterized protein MELLADRAFT_96290 [Melampsora larici-populina 98AG31]EGG09316.1 hypothetical protein MELLADRAFT_96290 [Melampsora larici-populina 98AG31]